MSRRLGQRQHRRHAGVLALEQRHPLVAVAGLEARAQLGLQRRPGVVAHRRRHRRIAGRQVARRVQPHAFDESAVELRLDRRHRQMPTVAAFVDVVVVRAAAEQLAAGAVIEQSMLAVAEEHRHERQRTVDHGRIDHLAQARAPRLQQCAGDAVGHQQAAATEITDDVERHHRPAVGGADLVQQAGEADVVEVVPGALRQRPLLAPAGHSRVDQLRIAGEARLRPDAQPLGDAGPEGLDQHIGLLDHRQQRRHVAGLLQVQRHRATIAQQRRIGRRVGTAARALDAHHLGAHVGEHHAAVGRRAQPGDLDDPHPVQRTA